MRPLMMLGRSGFAERACATDMLARLPKRRLGRDGADATNTGFVNGTAWQDRSGSWREAQRDGM